MNLKVPTSAAWLGGLGVVPFVLLAATLPFIAGETKQTVAHALVAYGAIILSFLGGVHWGLAIGASQGQRAQGARLPKRLGISVIPSLVAWAAMLIPVLPGLMLLTAATALMLWLDILASRRGDAPPWYPRLRIPLTCAVTVSLLASALA